MLLSSSCMAHLGALLVAARAAAVRLLGLAARPLERLDLGQALRGPGLARRVGVEGVGEAVLCSTGVPPACRRLPTASQLCCLPPTFLWSPLFSSRHFFSAATSHGESFCRLSSCVRCAGWPRVCAQQGPAAHAGLHPGALRGELTGTFII